MFAVKLVLHNLEYVMDTFSEYLLAYLGVSAFVSVAFVYYKGPVSNPRSLKLIEWSLKACSLVFLYMSLSVKDLFVAFLVGFGLVNLMCRIKSLKIVFQLK